MATWEEIRGKLVKASKLSNTDLKENTRMAESGFHSMNEWTLLFVLNVNLPELSNF